MTATKHWKHNAFS